jgi:integrase
MGLPLLPTPESATAVDLLAHWTSLAQGAFAPNTLRAWRADWNQFSAFCQRLFAMSLPAHENTVRDYVFDCVARGKKAATIRRYVATIGRAHRAVGGPDPTATEAVKLAVKAMSRTLPARQHQARGLVWADIATFLTFKPRHLRDIRDRALVTVAYDTMCRREELISLHIEDISPASDGSATILIRRSKTDPAGEGARPYLSALTMRLLQAWLSASRLQSGPLFAQVLGREVLGGPISAAVVAAVLKKVGRWLDQKDWKELSGHSARVGATQDLLALNLDLLSVMQAGRWKDTRMPMRYGEQLLAERGAMARAAKTQGRT